MSYSSASDVAMFCANLTNGSANFWESSQPPLKAVEGWLSTGCGRIHFALEAAGYSTPVTTATPGLYSEVSQLETYYGVAMAEYSRLSARVTNKERTRAQIFMDMFTDGLAALVGKDLAQAGQGVSGTAPIHVGGISKDRKSTVTDNTDAVEPRFKRGQFDFAGTVESSDYEDESN